MSARISPPSWMISESEGRAVRALGDVLPRVESDESHHRQDDDGEYQIRSLEDVLREAARREEEQVPEGERSQEDETAEQAEYRKEAGSGEYDTQEPGDPQTDEAPDKVQPAPSERSSQPVSSSVRTAAGEDGIGREADSRSEVSEQSASDALSADPEEVGKTLKQEISMDFEGMIRQEAEAVFEEERRRAWASVEEEVTSMRARLAESLRKMEAKAREIAESFDDNYLKLLEILVKKIVMRELSVSREGIRNIIEETVSMTGNNEPVVVRISPDDYEYLMEYEAQWLDSVMKDGYMKLEVDEELAPGDCVVESRLGRVDNTVQQRIEKIVEAIYDAADTSQ